MDSLESSDQMGSLLQVVYGVVWSLTTMEDQGRLGVFCYVRPVFLIAMDSFLLAEEKRSPVSLTRQLL